MTQSKSQNFCPYCGAPVANPQAHFCGNCGKALPAGMNDIPQMKKDADKISPEVKETPASLVKEDASAATESAPGIPVEPEIKTRKYRKKRQRKRIRKAIFPILHRKGQNHSSRHPIR